MIPNELEYSERIIRENIFSSSLITSWNIYL